MQKNSFYILLFMLMSTIHASAQPRYGEKGWTNLFDGKTLAGWKVLAGTATYEVVDNAIVGTTVANSRNTFLVTEKLYDDFVLELEVMLQDTTLNSGIQFRSQFDPQKNNGQGQVFGYQFELDPSARRWTGGIYDESRRGWLYPGALNPLPAGSFKAGVYNKVRIECIGNDLKTWINDIPAAYVIDSVDRSGFIALQVHSVNSSELVGKKIHWKNIRIKTSGLKPTPFPDGKYIVNLIPNDLSDYERKNGWRLLFNGRNPDGWIGAYKNTFPEKGWVIADGTLSVLPSDGGESSNGGDIVTQEQFAAFDLSFDFKFTPGANSGVKYFVTLSEGNKGSAIGLEYQILDDKLHPDAKMGRDGNRTLASLYDLIPAQKQDRFVQPPGQWNRGRIVVHPDNRVEHYLNGVKVLEYVRGSQAYRDLVAISKYKVWNAFGEAPQGRILLQDHGNAVSFRSIKIKKLKG
ncbi:MAG TPA: DUF1080 domain-containing protein [Chitinophagaceae bacterium]|nr:DUF1080 domain-containing protein [Chitinophagaceae bacterium]